MTKSSFSLFSYKLVHERNTQNPSFRKSPSQKWYRNTLVFYSSSTYVTVKVYEALDFYRELLVRHVVALLSHKISGPWDQLRFLPKTGQTDMKLQAYEPVLGRRLRVNSAIVFNRSHVALDIS